MQKTLITDSFSQLAEILRQIGRFSEADVLLFEKHVLKMKFAKNEILLAEGEVCLSVYFLNKGAVYQYYMQDVDENIIDLHLEKDWFLNAQSFMAQEPSHTTIKSYSDCEILQLSVQQLHELIALSPAFFQLGKVMENGKERAHFFDNAMTPSQKYEHLISNRPGLFQAFPLKMIASYLKITPETLSRVRAVF
jgi:CRP-like cAMP-binding protein